MCCVMLGDVVPKEDDDFVFPGHSALVHEGLWPADLYTADVSY